MNLRSSLLLFALLALPLAVPAQDYCRQRTAEDFVPLTLSERLVNMGNSVYGPRAFFAVGLRAGLDHARNRQNQWGQGVEGFSLRAGNAWAERFIGQVFEQSVAYRLHEDNRYFASGQHGAARRVGYAVASAVLTRHDDGSRGFAYSAVGGRAFGAFVARAWQPRDTTSPGNAAISFGMNMAIEAGINVLREFTPRFLRSKGR